jgi:hypothetical protein
MRNNSAPPDSLQSQQRPTVKLPSQAPDTKASYPDLLDQITTRSKNLNQSTPFSEQRTNTKTLVTKTGQKKTQTEVLLEAINEIYKKNELLLVPKEWTLKNATLDPLSDCYQKEEDLAKSKSDLSKKQKADKISNVEREFTTNFGLNSAFENA